MPFLFWSGFWAGFDRRKGKKQQMEEHILRIIILGIISWATAFQLLRKLLPKRSFEFCNRLVSTVHATLAFTLASLSVEDWTCPVCPPASKPSPSQVINAVILLSKYGLLRIYCVFLLQIHSRILLIVSLMLRNWADANLGSFPFLSHL